MEMTTITLPRAVVEQALEALESGDWYINQLEQIVYSADDAGTHEERAKVQAAITALRAALAQQFRPAVRAGTVGADFVKRGVDHFSPSAAALTMARSMVKVVIPLPLRGCRLAH